MNVGQRRRTVASRLRLLPGVTDGAIEQLAEELHGEYRAAFKALHFKFGEVFAGACCHEHDHGWTKCHTKDYFRARAARLIFDRANPNLDRYDALKGGTATVYCNDCDGTGYKCTGASCKTCSGRGALKDYKEKA